MTPWDGAQVLASITCSCCLPCWGNRGDKWGLNLRPCFSSDITGKIVVTAAQSASVYEVPGSISQMSLLAGGSCRGLQTPRSAKGLSSHGLGGFSHEAACPVCWPELRPRDASPLAPGWGILVPSLHRESGQETAGPLLPRRRVSPQHLLFVFQGNDQVRFELTCYALCPNIKVRHPKLSLGPHRWAPGPLPGQWGILV